MNSFVVMLLLVTPLVLAQQMMGGDQGMDDSSESSYSEPESEPEWGGKMGGGKMGLMDMMKKKGKGSANLIWNINFGPVSMGGGRKPGPHEMKKTMMKMSYVTVKVYKMTVGLCKKRCMADENDCSAITPELFMIRENSCRLCMLECMACTNEMIAKMKAGKVKAHMKKMGYPMPEPEAEAEAESEPEMEGEPEPKHGKKGMKDLFKMTERMDIQCQRFEPTKKERNYMYKAIMKIMNYGM